MWVEGLGIRHGLTGFLLLYLETGGVTGETVPSVVPG